MLVIVPEDWVCDYTNAIQLDDNICEMFENGDERILFLPKCGELLLLKVEEDDIKKYDSMH